MSEQINFKLESIQPDESNNQYITIKVQTQGILFEFSTCLESYNKSVKEGLVDQFFLREITTIHEQTNEEVNCQFWG